MSDEKAIVPAQPRQLLSTYSEVERAANAMAASGFFQDSRNAAQAVVKILAGQELGFGPFASMKGVYIIQGGPSFSANMMAAAVKKSGRYNYRLHQGHPTASECSIDFYENFGGKWEMVGTSTFTLDDARKAQTKNLDKFARNMLFARAMSNGVRWYCPDVFNGTPVYTPEELGAEVDQEGNVVNGQFKTLEQPPAPAGMVDTGKALGAEVTEQPHDLKWAVDVRTANGTRFGDLTVEQLKKVQTYKHTQEQREAAELLIDAAEAAEADALANSEPERNPADIF